MLTVANADIYPAVGVIPLMKMMKRNTVSMESVTQVEFLTI
jgi:hypothetical protein